MVVSASAVAAGVSAEIRRAVELVGFHGFCRWSDSIFALVSVRNWRIVISGFDSIAWASRPIIRLVSRAFAKIVRLDSSRSCSISVSMVFWVISFHGEGLGSCLLGGGSELA